MHLFLILKVMKKNIIYYGLFMFIVALISWYFLSGDKSKDISEQKSITTSTKLEIIDEHLTINENLRDVNFCGKILKVKEVTLDGVDIIQKIGELITNDKIPTKLQESIGGWHDTTVTKEDMQKMICGNVTTNNPTGIINVNQIKKLPSKETSFPKEDVYSLNISQGFIISVSTGNIYLESGYDGSLRGPIGNIK